MTIFKFFQFITLTLITSISQAQITDTLYYDLEGELIIKEISSIYRIAEFDTLSGFVINRFRDYNVKNDSLIGEGIVTLNSNNKQDILEFSGSENQKIISNKMLELKASFVRINDYPHLKKFIKPYKSTEERIKTEYDNFINVELNPEFPGGLETLGWFIGQFIKYPKEAEENIITGTVKVGFQVNKDGTLSNIHVISGIGYGCDEEAIRLMKLIPDWLPALQRGKPFKVHLELPITFE